MRTIFVVTVVCAALCLAWLSAQRSPAPKCAAPVEQSWDQENLKRHDVGCPTAIYSAPNGNLQLCEPGVMINGMDVTPIPKPEPVESEAGAGPQVFA